jgi:hypothetical protein
LYVFDLIQKVGEDNITEQEALQELQNAKANEELFNKKIGAIRNEYKQLESDSIYREQLAYQTQAQENFNRFAGQIANQIDNFRGFNGLSLELDREDKEELYDFITGMDDAGTSVLGKAFNDPRVLVQAAWFALMFAEKATIKGLMMHEQEKLKIVNLRLFQNLKKIINLNSQLMIFGFKYS